VGLIFGGSKLRKRYKDNSRDILLR